MVLTYGWLTKLRKQNRGREIDIFIHGNLICDQEGIADQADQSVKCWLDSSHVAGTIGHSNGKNKHRLLPNTILALF